MIVKGTKQLGSFRRGINLYTQKKNIIQQELIPSLWLKADAGVIYDENNNVTFWEDQSPNGLDFTSDIGAGAYPIRLANGINSKPSISFLNSFMGTVNTTFGNSKLSIFVVGYSRGDGETGGAGGDLQSYINKSDLCSQPYDAFSFGAYGGTETDFEFSAWVAVDDGSNYVAVKYPNAVNTPRIITSINRSETLDIYINGTLSISQPCSITPQTLNAPIGIGNRSIRSGGTGCTDFGSRENFDGVISEIIIYNRALTNTERQQVEAYLNEKYQINLLLNLDANQNSSYSGSGNTWFDLTPPSNDITLINSPAFNSTGPKYFSFNGSNQYGTSIGETVPSTAYTKCVWFRVNTFAGHANNLVSSSNGGHFMYFAGTNKMYCGHSDWQNYQAYESTTSFNEDVWYFAALTFNTTDGMKLYINGVLDSTYTANKNPHPGDGSTNIATYDGANLFNGDISIVKTFNKALTEQEILNIYNNTKNIYFLIPTNGLSLWLKADAGVSLSGSNVTAWADQSENSNNLTLFEDQNLSSPTFTTNILNNYPSINFNSNAILKNSSLNLSKYTVFHVSKVLQDGDGEGRVFSARGYSNVLIGSWNNYTNRMFAGGWVYQGTSTSDTWKITCGIVDSTTPSSSFYQNGLALAENVGIGSSMPDGICLGGWVWGNGSSFFEAAKCSISEVIIYNRVLTTSERQQVETYLNQKYAIY